VYSSEFGRDGAACDVHRIFRAYSLASTLLPAAAGSRLVFQREVQQMTRKLIVGLWVILCLVVIGSVSSSAFQGRFKDDGNGGCFFDPNDDGFDQCSPTTAPNIPPAGRFKDDGNGGCFFDANDDGPNQCTPPSTPGAAKPTSPASATASRRGR
jgi:hypothetical protein